MNSTRLSRFAWGVLSYNLLVILWGAWVRVTGSGAGCGSHWPMCNGEVLPRSPTAQTLVEFSHRLMSGLDLILVVALFVWVFRARPKGDPARSAASWTLVFLLLEALLGAGLVLFELVANDASAARAYAMSLHLANTFLLLGWMTRTAWVLGGGTTAATVARGPKAALLWGRVGIVAVGVTGGIAALGDTLFPGTTLTEAHAVGAPLLLQLRVLHPVVAVVVGVGLFAAGAYARTRLAAPGVQRMSRLLTVLVVVQLLAGAINVALLAPGWLQIVHLLLADLLWIAGTLLALEISAARAPEASASAVAPAH
ncbi:MAG: COX15/CtaA family protein [Myxococcota bacterium]|nr:COX15/CtaA family protein [Myxococcota bacterium]